MIIVFLGAPGSGKGTQTDRLLTTSDNFCKISTGDVLRKHISNRTELGLRVQEIMARGELVSDDILLELVKTELMQNTGKAILFDGYPRTVNQANALDTLGKDVCVSAAIHLDVAEAELIDRLGGRRTCPKCSSVYHYRYKQPIISGKCDSCGSDLEVRPDDAPENVRVRMQVFATQTAPIIEYYKQKGLYYRVDGGKHPDAVYADILQLVEKIVASHKAIDTTI